MKNLFIKIILVVLVINFSSCSKDDENRITSIIGTWELTTWTIGIPMDLNDDGIFHDNLLVESNCANNETLFFESNGTFSSNLSYNPTVLIHMENNDNENYIFDVTCDTEGTIGLSGSYEQNGNEVLLIEKMAILSNNQLTVIYENAIDIYNEDDDEIVASRDLTLIYTKKQANLSK
ncbi:MAG: hypothetical protein R2797_06830 [Gelidibacter sp.]